MPEHPNRFRCLAVAVALLLVGVLASTASAANFGEIGQIGSKGTGKGQFSVSEETDGFGVDPSDNSVYVVDLPDEKNEFRLQKFSSNEKGELKFVASVTFKPKDPSGVEEADTIEGVAIDPAMHRVYLLAIQERENQEVDNFNEAAGELYAFSTQESGEALVPASGTEEGLLAGTKILKPQGKKFGEALLEPKGIAVEPISATQDNVILLGEVDTGKKNEHNVEIRQNTFWWITSAGALSSEKKYTDTSEVLEDEGTSPVVSNGKLYVAAEEGLYEIPSALTGAPKNITQANEEEITFYEEMRLWLTPPLQEPFYGDGLAVSPEGTFWETASIRNAGAGDSFYPGAVSFDSAGKVVGWTGGQSAAKTTQCALGIVGTPHVAAGKEFKPGSGPVMFLLDTTTSAPKLVQFGNGGHGCPEASATAPAASVNKVAVEESVGIPIASTVEFKSTVTQGNALSVEWNFNDGGPVTKVSTLEEQQTFVTHKFASPGTHEVVETIHTDNLANPTVVVHSKVTSLAAAPTATTEPAVAKGFTHEILKGKINPNGNPTKCFFEYGKTTAYEGGKKACAKDPGSGQSAVAVEAEVEGLAEQTEYHFRVVAEYGAHEETKGADLHFRTGPNPPAVTTKMVSLVTTTSATLNAGVNPEGTEVTECVLEYGKTIAYEGGKLPCSPAPGSGTSEVSVSASVTGLTPATLYHFRVVAKNSNPTVSVSADRTFETAAEPPPNNGGGGGGGGNTGNTGGNNGSGDVLNNIQASPIAALASGGSVSVNAKGAFTLKISCPKAAGVCTGTVVLKTAGAVAARSARTAKKVILTLATGSFTVTEGQSKTITLHLSAKARKLLGKLHTVRGKATITAHNSSASHTTLASVTLRAPKKKH